MHIYSISIYTVHIFIYIIPIKSIRCGLKILHKFDELWLELHRLNSMGEWYAYIKEVFTTTAAWFNQFMIMWFSQLTLKRDQANSVIISNR